MAGIGECIKLARIDKGYTQKQLAEKCVPQMFDSAIRRYELGLKIPSLEMIKRISAALDLEVYELMSYAPANGTEILVDRFYNVVNDAMNKAAASDQAQYGEDTLEKTYAIKRTDVFAAASTSIDRLSEELKTILHE